MSYGFKVTAVDGVLTVTDVSGTIPNGSFVVNGHEPMGNESTSVGVWLNAPDGTARMYAYAAASLPAPAPAPAPAAEQPAGGEQA